MGRLYVRLRRLTTPGRDAARLDQHDLNPNGARSRCSEPRRASRATVVAGCGPFTGVEWLPSDVALKRLT
jgi:hypothetical protein